ncbi:MAG: Prolyl-tRNA synthetase [Candidatus Curtissbacteria bacterium GW2011_GWA1_41_11]|uniref:Proline--tRNA ligase n=1 Tax=Candidatus Curtissbacteria bacterium GW2011_GWA1_41_11 TaxID=1618409 RepID=A0A0G0UK62_9BACT|nr:MAG: Prolyl-tRNA synthetase [Candidatus Curtissbacteria bacterium GW2011_GWA1_41_11]
MRLSQLISKTSKQVPHDEVSTNAKLLIRAGFIRKEVAGVYNFLPLGLRVINKISQIVREEMNAAGGQEVLLSALQNKKSWEATGRWKSFDALFKVKSKYQADYALGPTHEEVLVPIAKEFVSSYRDLPLYIFQIQNKFRDEARAKAGLLRGREFLMKDLYSFHESEKDMLNYYEKMKTVYTKTFKRLGLETIETKAAGGTFSDFSHEYQVICESGEDEIIYCPGGDYAENTEIATVKEGKQCDLGHGPLKKVKTIEVGNIFPLKDKFSKAFNLTYKDRSGKDHLVLMGCYGIGISRLMGAIVEVHHDEKGIIWPKQVSPFSAHLLVVSDESGVTSQAEEIYKKLTKAGINVLWDDRENVSAGEKFADCDLIGIPIRLVVSKKVGKGKLEVKSRDNEKTEVIPIDQLLKRFS